MNVANFKYPFRSSPTQNQQSTHLKPVFHFYTPCKRHKTSGFKNFQGAIEIEHWLKMG